MGDRQLKALTSEDDWPSTVPVEQIPAVIVQLGALQQRLAARWMDERSAQAAELDGGDTLLRVDDAAARLGTSRDWLYRHAAQLPFTVRAGRRQLRFSSGGIDRYIRQRQGR